MSANAWGRKRLLAEYLKLKARLDDLAEPRLSEMRIENGAIEMTVEEGTGLVHRMAAAMCAMLNGVGAQNYLQQEVSVATRDYVLLVQRRDGKTPHQLRLEAEAARDSEREACAAIADSFAYGHPDSTATSIGDLIRARDSK